MVGRPGFEPGTSCTQVAILSKGITSTKLSAAEFAKDREPLAKYLWDWSGCRDSNPGPLAPQAKFINHLQGMLTENTGLSKINLDARWTPRRAFSRFGLHSDSNNDGIQ